MLATFKITMVLMLNSALIKQYLAFKLQEVFIIITITRWGRRFLRRCSCTWSSTQSTKLLIRMNHWVRNYFGKEEERFVSMTTWTTFACVNSVWASWVKSGQQRVRPEDNIRLLSWILAVRFVSEQAARRLYKWNTDSRPQWQLEFSRRAMRGYVHFKAAVLFHLYLLNIFCKKVKSWQANIKHNK